jgi:hypothetical protein
MQPKKASKIEVPSLPKLPQEQNNFLRIQNSTTVCPIDMRLFAPRTRLVFIGSIKLR